MDRQLRHARFKTMQIQEDSNYANDNDGTTLLAAAEEQAAGIYYCLKLTRLWVASSALPAAQREHMANDEKTVASVYAGTLSEIADAFGQDIADSVRERVETTCVIPPNELPPAEQQSLF